MPDDKRKILYDAVSKDYDVGTLDEFNKKLDDPAKQKALYDAVGTKYDLGTFDEFSAKVKKKGTSESPSPVSGGTQSGGGETSIGDPLDYLKGVAAKNQDSPEVTAKIHSDLDAQKPIKTSYIGGAVKSFDDALADNFKLVGGVVDKVGSLIPGYDVMKSAGVVKNPFNDVADVIKKSAENNAPLPDNFAGNLVGSASAMIPDLIGMAVSPEIKTSKMIADLGMKTFPKVAEYIAAKEGTEEALKGGTPTEQIINPITGVVKGFASGMAMEGIGKATEPLATSIATKLFPASKIGYKATQTAVKTIGDALGFGGLGAAQEFMETGKVTAKNVASNAGMGAAFGLVGGMFSKGLDNVVAKSTDDIQHIVDNPKSAKEMQGESDKLANETETSINKAKTDGIQIPEEANQNIMAASAIHNAAVTKATVEDMVEKPQDYIDAVQKSELPDDKKQEVIDKINEVVAANDPKAIEAKPVIDKMNGLLQQVMNNDNNKALSDVEKDIKNKPLQAQVEELKKQVEDIYNKPKVEPKVEEPTFPHEEKLPANVAERAKGENSIGNPITAEEWNKIPQTPVDVATKFPDIPQEFTVGANVIGVDKDYFKGSADPLQKETADAIDHKQFSEGGNDKAYPNFIPKNTIVVDDTQNDIGQQGTIVHEGVERQLMEKGLVYDHAHNIAADIEEHFREGRVDEAKKLFADELAKAKPEKTDENGKIVPVEEKGTEKPVEIVPEEKASVPVMITNKMRQQLSDLGYTKEQIGELKPEDAGKIINEKVQSNTPKGAESTAKEVSVPDKVQEPVSKEPQKGGEKETKEQDNAPKGIIPKGEKEPLTKSTAKDKSSSSEKTTKVEPKKEGEPDATTKQSTEKVSLGERPEVSSEVRGRNPEGEETTGKEKEKTESKVPIKKKSVEDFTKKEAAKEKIRKGVEGLMEKWGAKKNITPEERTTLIEDIKNLAEGITDLSIEELKDFIREQIQPLIEMLGMSKKDVDDVVNGAVEKIRKGASFGVSKGAQERRAAQLGTETAERLSGVSTQQMVERGRQLTSSGADFNAIADDYKKNGKVSIDDINVLFTHADDLARETNKAEDDFGVESKQYKEALAAENKWNEEIVNPLANQFFHQTGERLQGEVTPDDATLAGISKQFRKKYQTDLPEEKKDFVKGLAGKVREQEESIKNLQQKLDDAMKRAKKSEKETPSKPKRGRDLMAEGFDELATALNWKMSAIGDVRPDAGKALVKIGRGLIDEGLATAENVYEKIKQYVKEKFDKDLPEDYKEQIAGELGKYKGRESAEAKGIRLKEKQIEDLHQGKAKTNKDKRPISEREKELNDEIADLKDKLGLTPSKPLPEEVRLNNLRNKLAKIKKGEEDKPVKSDDTPEIKDLKEQIAEARQETENIKLSTQFIGKTDNKFTVDEATAVWDYAKTKYIDKNVNPRDMLVAVGRDLHLKPEQVRYAINTPKDAKPISDEIYRRMGMRREAKQQVKSFIENAEKPMINKAVTEIPNFFRALATFGHGTVMMFTHAATNISTPSRWKYFFPRFIEGFKNAYGNISEYEKRMEDLTFRPNYILAQKAGLRNNPYIVYDEYQGLGKYLPKFLGKLSKAGDRGFNTLKPLRQDFFDQEWDKASEIAKADPTFAKDLARYANHLTGSISGNINEGWNYAFFAPKLEMSRWGRIIDVTRPLITLSKVSVNQVAKLFTDNDNWTNVTPGERRMAKIIGVRSAETIGVYMAALAANQGLLMATGSKDKINAPLAGFIGGENIPFRGDWMKFKVGGQIVDMTGGIVSAINFVGRLGEITLNKVRGRTTEEDKQIYEDLGGYLRGKLSPFSGTVFNWIVHHTYNNDVLPPFKEKPEKGKIKLTWPQYVGTQHLPIPVAEAWQDVLQTMKEKGIKEVDAKRIVQGATIFLLSGGTGVKIKEEPKYKKQSNSTVTAIP